MTEIEPVNLRLVIEGEEASKYRRLMKKRGLTVANQLPLVILTEHYHSELGEA